MRLRIAYDGTAYHGWQRQPGIRTVEGELRCALSKILNLTEDQFIFRAASRTDAGVHALGQTAHLAHATDRTPWDIARGTNALTKDDICVVRVEETHKDFHSHGSASGKIYRYRIWNHRFAHPHHYHTTWHIVHPLNLETMREAACHLIGRHDFSAFRASDCDNPKTIKTLTDINIVEQGAEVIITVTGDAFLKYMVRIIAGTLAKVGHGRLKPDAIPGILASKQKSNMSPTAPARGLTLMAIHYPNDPWQAGSPILGGPVVL